jgi:hypothetical protein
MLFQGLENLIDKPTSYIWFIINRLKRLYGSILIHACLAKKVNHLAKFFQEPKSILGWI